MRASFSEENEMGEESKPQAGDVEALNEQIEKLEANNKLLSERIKELEAENERLRETIGKAEDTLKTYVAQEKKAAIESILEKTNWSKDELEKLDLSQLKLIQKTIDRAKGSFKGIRSGPASATATDKEPSVLTVGDLYGKKQEK
jgi:predicted RNase H-like nuclease (RuvC/YqgF family)